MSAAPRREGDDGGDRLDIDLGIGARERQRTPAAGGMAEHDGPVLADKIPATQKFQRKRDLLSCRAARTYVVGFVAAALLLEVAAAGRAVAEPLRHQHGKAARDQERRQRAVFRLRHLRATQHVLRRGVRDQRQPKRTVSGRAE